VTRCHLVMLQGKPATRSSSAFAERGSAATDGYR
jgi:hypothetical protein